MSTTPLDPRSRQRGRRPSIGAIVAGLAMTMALLVTLHPSAAWAQSSGCTIAASGMNLGVYTGARQTSGSGTLSVRCPSSVVYQVLLSAGTGVGATTTTRKLTGPGGATLNYKLFQFNARTLNWGNQPGVDTRNGSGTGFVQTLTIYPDIAAGQNLPQGTYTDTVTASLSPDGSAVAFVVTATIQPTCSISAGAMNFGVYAAAALRTNATITVNCTNSASWSLGLNAGTYAGATTTTRTMTGPSGGTLAYSLFSDGTYTSNWGDSVGIDTRAGIGTGNPQAVTVYGQVNANQQVNPGAYSDTIIATITY